MQFTAKAITVALLSLVANAIPVKSSIDINQSHCATVDLSTQRLAEMRKAANELPAISGFGDPEPIEVSVHFHLHNLGPGDQTVQKGIDLLNRNYDDFIFKLEKIHRYDDDALLSMKDEETYSRFTSASRVGGNGTMNIYVTEVIFETYEINGFATMSPGEPWDGMLLRSTRLTTDTIVHEMGHWLFLPHTFQGECDGNGLDTPPQKKHWSCQAVDTCPGDNRLDDVSNWMGYGIGCRSKFTEGQKQWMRTQWYAQKRGTL